LIAILRIENAVLLALAILLAFFLPNPLPALLPWWGAWTWLLAGLAGVALVSFSALKDPQEREKAVERLFREKYNVTGLRDRPLRDKLKKAEGYHQQIKATVKTQKDGILKDRMQRTTGEIYDWIGNMVRLARRLDSYRVDPIIKGDREELVKSIPSLEARLRQETDPRVRQQIETTLADQRRLQENIGELDNRMQRADLQLDSSLAALGTVYSQLLLVGSKEVDSDRAERLSADISNEVASLQDVVDSINEVYDYRTLGPGM
jgi:transcriptional regulator with AAA-type ATPase domain